MTLYGAVEMGGTKTDLVVGTSPADMSDPERLPTSDPETTLGQVSRFFEEHAVDAVGVATFGPLDLDPRSPRYGTISFTPKPGWTGTAVYSRLHDSLDVPVVVDTDVNGAALGEGRWGATSGMSDFAYVTVGTGIGAGIVVDGRPIGGERHPEMGHIAVSRAHGDVHEGNCPYHGGCLEGMAAGPALEARFGRPGTWPGNDNVVDLATHYVAQGLVALVYMVAPERIVVGGGVSRLPGFHDRLRTKVATMLGGYPNMPDLDLLISQPGLGERSGLAGALLLAAGALA